MLLLAVLTAGGLYSLNYLLPPRYASTATLYILRQSSNDQQISEDFSLALNVVSDCDHLLKSHSVLDAVIENLALDISYKDLRSSVSTNNPDSTRILEVTAEAQTPARAKAIVDSICTIGTDKIRQAMGFAQVNLYEYGIWDSEPCNRITPLHCVLGFCVGAAAVYCLALLAFLLKPSREPEKSKTVVKVARAVKKS
jgi:capsular polysaccharide biosynthesis protein